jgi:hypothetical protein
VSRLGLPSQGLGEMDPHDPVAVVRVTDHSDEALLFGNVQQSATQGPPLVARRVFARLKRDDPFPNPLSLPSSATLTALGEQDGDIGQLRIRYPTPRSA